MCNRLGSRAVLIALAALLCALLAAPASAAILNGVQTDAATLSGASTSNTISLPRTVDASRAFVTCTYLNDTGTPSRRATCNLASNGASVTIVQGVADNGTQVRWAVADFQSGVVVQRGSATFAAGETQPGGATVALTTAVDLTKSFVVVYDRSTSTSNTVDEQRTIRARLTSSTTLELMRLESGIVVNVEWQVIEMQGASVQRGTLCIGANATCPGSNGQTNTATLATSVDTDKSFIVLSAMAGTAVGGVEAQLNVRGDFTSTGTAITGLTFARIESTTTANKHVQIAYEVVTLSDGTAVRRGQSGQLTQFGADTWSLTSSAFTAVDLSRTLPIISLAGGADGTNNDGTKANWRATLATTSFTFDRFNDSNNGQTATAIAWQAVQFFRCDTNPLCGVSARTESTKATVQWSPIYDANCVTSTSTPLGVCNALVLRNIGSVQVAPTNGTTYTAGNVIASGGNSATVVFSGTANSAAAMVNSLDDTGLIDATTYCYKVFYKTGAALTTYVNVSSSTGCTATSEVTARPAGGAMLWSYTLSGGAVLTPPTPGFGQVFAAGTAKKVFSLDSSTGTTGGKQLTELTQTHDTVQGYVSWFPVSFTASSETVLAADLAGYLYAIDATTGTVPWSKKLTADGFVAAVSVQLSGTMFTPQSWRDAYQTNFGYLGDVIYVATRNTSSTANQVFALKATDGTVLWTYTPSAAMDKVVAQPWVDYARNRLYVTSLAGSGSQLSLRVLSSLDGAEVTCSACANLGDIETAPGLSFDNNTLYIGAKNGNVYAFNADTLALKWTFGGASGNRIKGFIWEDYDTAGRLYFVAEGTSDDQIWSVQDNGTSASTVWTRTPSSGQRMSQPIIGYSEIPYLWSGSSDGKLYQLRLSDGLQLTSGGAAQSAFQVGDGTKTVGEASTEDLTALFIGTSGGTIYKIQVPLP